MDTTSETRSDGPEAPSSEFSQNTARYSGVREAIRQSLLPGLEDLAQQLLTNGIRKNAKGPFKLVYQRMGTKAVQVATQALDAYLATDPLEALSTQVMIAEIESRTRMRLLLTPVGSKDSPETLIASLVGELEARTGKKVTLSSPPGGTNS